MTTVCQQPSQRRKSAFTLVEMLSVLVAVSILSCILLSVYSRQRQVGYERTCRNNLSQIYSTMQMYIQDHDSRFPAYSSWANSLMPYAKSKEIFLCPLVKEHNQYHPEVDYDVYPERVAQFQKDIAGGVSGTSGNESAVSLPAKWILVTDIGNGAEFLENEGGLKGDLTMLEYPQDCSEKLSGRKSLGRSFSLLHRGGGHYLFADGHVKWLRPEVGMQTDCEAGPFLK